MNIFALDQNPKLAAKYHVDKHVVKQLLETAQLLSTAHRIIDGTMLLPETGRQVKYWKLQDSKLDSLLYKATHVNHPSAVWARASSFNYNWLFELLFELCCEYTHRYGKVHKTESSGVMEALLKTPDNMPIDSFTYPTPAMPDECKVEDVMQSYRNYYFMHKSRMFKWKNRAIPDWLLDMAPNSKTDYNEVTKVYTLILD